MPSEEAGSLAGSLRERRAAAPLPLPCPPADWPSPATHACLRSDDHGLRQEVGLCRLRLEQSTGSGGRQAGLGHAVGPMTLGTGAPPRQQRKGSTASRQRSGEARACMRRRLGRSPPPPAPARPPPSPWPPAGAREGREGRAAAGREEGARSARGGRRRPVAVHACAPRRSAERTKGPIKAVRCTCSFRLFTNFSAAPGATRQAGLLRQRAHERVRAQRGSVAQAAAPTDSRPLFHVPRFVRVPHLSRPPWWAPPAMRCSSASPRGYASPSLPAPPAARTAAGARSARRRWRPATACVGGRRGGGARRASVATAQAAPALSKARLPLSSSTRTLATGAGCRRAAREHCIVMRRWLAVGVEGSANPNRRLEPTRGELAQRRQRRDPGPASQPADLLLLLSHLIGSLHLTGATQ